MSKIYAVALAIALTIPLYVILLAFLSHVTDEVVFPLGIIAMPAVLIGALWAAHTFILRKVMD